MNNNTKNKTKQNFFKNFSTLIFFQQWIQQCFKIFQNNKSVKPFLLKTDHCTIKITLEYLRNVSIVNFIHSIAESIFKIAQLNTLEAIKDYIGSIITCCCTKKNVNDIKWNN